MKIELVKSNWYRELPYIQEAPINAGAHDHSYYKKYTQAGHQPATLFVDKCHLDSGMPELEPVETFFHFLSKVSYCVHKLKPGHYIPTHRDQYAYYADQNKIKNIEIIHRYIVFLEDGQDGHMLIINNQPILNYTAGQVAGWSGTVPHSALNFGLTNRYTLQVTGIIE